MIDYQDIIENHYPDVCSEYGNAYLKDKGFGTLHKMDDFNEVTKDLTHIEVAKITDSCFFNPYEEFFYLDRKGENYISTDYECEYWLDNIDDEQDFLEWCDNHGYLAEYDDGTPDEE